MKTLSGTVGLVVLAVIAIVAVLTIRAFAFATPHPAFADQKFVLKFGTKTEYVELTSQAEFDDALKALVAHGGQSHIGFLAKEGAKPIDPYQPDHRRVSIKTDKATKSELASSAAAGEAAANDPNVTYRVTANDVTDIENVLKTFKK